MIKVNLSIALILCLTIGHFSKNFIFRLLQEKPKNNQIGIINQSFKNSEHITFWGSSTSNMNFIPSIISDSLKVKCFNYGISGTSFNQQLHLDNFVRSHNNKVIVWVINPFHLFDRLQIIDEEELFIHWIDSSAIYEHFKNKSLLTGISLKHLGVYGLFKLTSKHWSYLINPKTEQIQHENGYVKRNSKFVNKNNMYEKKSRITKIKLDQLISKVEEISHKHELIIIIPPIINLENISPIQDLERTLKLKNIELINYANNLTFKDTLLFQDNIHLNYSGASKITKDLIQKFKARGIGKI